MLWYQLSWWYDRNHYFFFFFAATDISEYKAIIDFLLSATEAFHHVFLADPHKGPGG